MITPGGFPNRRRANVLTDEISLTALYQGASPRATLGVEEKQLRVQFAFFLRCKIGNMGSDGCEGSKL